MDKEEELTTQLRKIQNELTDIRQEKLRKNRESFVGKYLRTYIDDGNNRYQYIHIDAIVDGNLVGWWFTIGDTFTYEYSMTSKSSVILNDIADNVFYSPHTNDYLEIKEDNFWLAFDRIIECVEERKLSRK